MPVPPDFRDRILTQLHDFGLNVPEVVPEAVFDKAVDWLYQTMGGAAGELVRKFFDNELKGRAFVREVKWLAGELGITPPELAAQMITLIECRLAERDKVTEEAAAAGMSYQEFRTRSLALQLAEIQARAALEYPKKH